MIAKHSIKNHTQIPEAPPFFCLPTSCHSFETVTGTNAGFRFGLKQADLSNSSISADQITESLEEAGDDLLLRQVADETVGGQHRAVVRQMRLRNVGGMLVSSYKSAQTGADLSRICQARIRLDFC